MFWAEKKDGETKLLMNGKGFFEDTKKNPASYYAVIGFRYRAYDGKTGEPDNECSWNIDYDFYEVTEGKIVWNARSGAGICLEIKPNRTPAAYRKKCGTVYDECAEYNADGECSQTETQYRNCYEVYAYILKKYCRDCRDKAYQDYQKQGSDYWNQRMYNTCGVNFTLEIEPKYLVVHGEAMTYTMKEECESWDGETYCWENPDKPAVIGSRWIANNAVETNEKPVDWGKCNATGDWMNKVSELGQWMKSFFKNRDNFVRDARGPYSAGMDGAVIGKNFRHYDSGMCQRFSIGSQYANDWWTASGCTLQSTVARIRIVDNYNTGKPGIVFKLRKVHTKTHRYYHQEEVESGRYYLYTENREETNESEETLTLTFGEWYELPELPDNLPVMRVIKPPECEDNGKNWGGWPCWVVCPGYQEGDGTGTGQYNIPQSFDWPAGESFEYNLTAQKYIGE